LDLIFGHPAESTTSWRESVGRALALEPDHVSTYSLTVEPGTEFASQVASGATVAPDDDAQVDRYAFFEERATAAGIVRYEVSNHARTGHVCRYNLATWANAEYLGFGMAAHDHVDGLRSRNLRTIGRYLDAVESGQRPRAGFETLSDADEERDALMLGLRLAAGVPLVGRARDFADSPIGADLERARMIKRVDGRLVVVDPMRSDAVIREALSLSAYDC
jgi:oxygen-independent coproporphyrinogen-3 oxidase